MDCDVRGAEEVLYVGFHCAHDGAAALAHQAAYVYEVRQLVAGLFYLVFKVAALLDCLRRKILDEDLLVALALLAGKLRRTGKAAKAPVFPAALQLLFKKRREPRILRRHVRNSLLGHVSRAEDLQYGLGPGRILHDRQALFNVLLQGRVASGFPAYHYPVELCQLDRYIFRSFFFRLIAAVQQLLYFFYLFSNCLVHTIYYTKKPPGTQHIVLCRGPCQPDKKHVILSMTFK